MNKQNLLRKLIKEEVRRVLKESSGNGLESLNKGDIAYRLMERYNPQLGTYYVWSKATVMRVSPHILIKNDVGSTESYDKATGNRRNFKDSGYGRVYYSLYSEEAAREEDRRLKAKGQRTRGLD